MKQQTATEWLFEQLWDEPRDKFTWYAILSKAKQMEKEQIVEFANSFYDDCVTEGGSLKQSAEQYYDQTYNK